MPPLLRTRLVLAVVFASISARSLADARSDFLEAVEHQKAQRWAEAAQAYAKVTAQAPTHAPAWKQLATCRFYLGDLEGAEASSQRYLKLQPNDAGFAAWNGQLRQKLKMPPLDLGTPVPTPLPTPVAEEGPLSAVPAPDAVAEVVPEAMAAASSAAAAAAEPVAVAPARQAQTFGLRLAGAFHFGLGRFEHGEAVASSTAASGQAYPGQAALGPGALVELLWGRGPSFEWSLGAYPLFWSETQRSSRTDAVTRSNESTASATLLPLLLGAGWRLPLGPTVHGLLSAGLGVLPSAQVAVRTETVQTSANGLTNTRGQSSVSYALAPAWRLGAGVEVPLGQRSAFYLGAQVLGAQFAAAGSSSSFEVLDQSGAVLSSAQGVSGQAQALSVLSAGALAGLSFRY